MPLYEYECKRGHKTELIAPMELRDAVTPKCDHCKCKTKRLPGGHGLLYFEEGRARVDQALGGPPITSDAERNRRMRRHGVSEGNGQPPKKIRDNPKSEAMKRFLDKGHKGGWV